MKEVHGGAYAGQLVIARGRIVPMPGRMQRFHDLPCDLGGKYLGNRNGIPAARKVAIWQSISFVESCCEASELRLDLTANPQHSQLSCDLKVGTGARTHDS